MSEIRLFGKDEAVKTLTMLSSTDRMPHGIMLSGEKGIGKKALAQWCACLMICEAEQKPCCSCRQCSRVVSRTHPDVIYVGEESFKTEKIREIIGGSVVLPNDTDIRIYIFTDCDLMTVQQQNLLLKAIEEPAPFNRYIFTCSDTQKILTTIRSRLVNIPVRSLDDDECIRCLEYNGIEESRAREATESYGSNPGYIMGVLADEKKSALIRRSLYITEQIADSNEYEVLKELSAFTERADVFEALSIIYDNVCAAARPDKGSEQAAKLRRKLPLKKLCMLADKLSELMSFDTYNPNVKIFVSDISSEIFDILL